MNSLEAQLLAQDAQIIAESLDQKDITDKVKTICYRYAELYKLLIMRKNPLQDKFESMEADFVEMENLLFGAKILLKEMKTLTENGEKFH